MSFYRGFVLTCVAALSVLLPSGCSQSTRAEPSHTPSSGGAERAIRLVDVAPSAGIDFSHTSGRSGRLYLPETTSGGGGFLDYDGDGHLDIFLVNSAPLPGFTGKGPFYPALYRNRGDGTFEDVTKRAGLAHQMYGMGCAAGDYDNDGDTDLFVSGLGPDRLYRNNGDGTFADVTRTAGVSDGYFSTSCAWLDYDRDGRLDLFVGTYCKWTPATNKVCKGEFGEHMCSPEYYRGDPPRLYRNRGDGTFEDVTKKAGVYSTVGKNLGVLTLDVDDDGWLDLMLANDQEPNLLYRNNQDGTFREIGVEAGIAYSLAGKARAGMGIDSADIGNDGRETIVVGNNTGEGLALFRAESPGPGTAGVAFADEAEPAGVYGPSLPFLTFGTLFVDLDNDGLKDLFAANGHVNERIDRHRGIATYLQRPMLFRNLGGGRFADIAAAAGPGVQERSVGRGIASGDYDRDGDLDLLLTVCNGRPKLLRNETPRSAHWLAIRTRGTRSNRDGIGTRVIVEASGIRQQGWVRSGSGYLSMNDLVAWFGLGTASRAEKVTLRWPSGALQTLTNVPADQVLQVTEPAS
jgi:hypothetical protein